MKKIVIVPEHIYEEWDEDTFEGYRVREAILSFRNSFSDRQDLTLEYYFRNRKNKGVIQKAVSNANGKISVVDTESSDIVQVFSNLSKEDKRDSLFLIDIWCDESKHFGTTMQTLADIISKCTNNFAFFNKVGGDELYMREWNDDKKSFVQEIREKYKGKLAENLLIAGYPRIFDYLQIEYFDKDLLKFGDDIDTCKQNLS